jgi:hypothetical protein
MKSSFALWKRFASRSPRTRAIAELKKALAGPVTIIRHRLLSELRSDLQDPMPHPLSAMATSFRYRAGVSLPGSLTSES